MQYHRLLHKTQYIHPKLHIEWPNNNDKVAVTKKTNREMPISDNSSGAQQPG